MWACPNRANLSQRREQMSRRTMAALGYNECVTYSFIDQVAAARFVAARMPLVG